MIRTFQAKTSLDYVQNLISAVTQKMSTASRSLEANRQALDEGGASQPLPPGMLLHHLDLSSNLSGVMFTPKEKPKGVILYFHGGGYCTGSAVSHRPLCAQIAQTASRHLLSVNYRLAPEHKYPSALTDALTSYNWLLSQGYPCDQIVFAGDSAGGGLAMAALLHLRDHCATGLPMPGGAIGLSPWLDLSCSCDSYQRNGHIDQLATAEGLRMMGLGYLGGANVSDPWISPFFANDLEGLCPLLLQVGSAETLVDEVSAFANCASESEVDVELQIWENMVHVWHSFSEDLPESRMAIQSIADWLDAK